ncbi:MAG TPA: DHH family phosphoesterase [Saprospirales bacterium]|nr:DHH family phosphoesterase [Saprospirales bacterium]
MDSLSELKDLLNAPKNVVIFSHRNPDGDAIGSSLALHLMLEKNGHQVATAFPSEFPSTLSFLKDSDRILIHDFEAEEINKRIRRADIMFFLDFSGLDRIDKMGEQVVLSQAFKVHIDHHLDPEPFSDVMYWDADASSTSELVFSFFGEMGFHRMIDSDIANCLMTGLISDTGSFKYNVNPKTFNIAGDLLKYGIDINSLQDNIYNRLSEKVLRLLGHCLVNRMEIIPEYKAGIIKLYKEDYADFNIQRGDTEGIVNYLLMINEVEIAALITEQPTIIKISLRSKGNISVQEIARDHFKGGGHKNAAGGALYGSMDYVVTKFKNLLPKYIKKI